ncbi:Gfo/Idh/MocA family oxidoreductase [Bacillus ndiopicus]|uniref:Gfo/Idh/MocA family oxidoreductase n=1 Tax=Bacillus ndiopicus TaxID=1347368 RepID=UPI0005A850EC|nr:Gfo/Idh/MocA family oxidoreductase [Bacillus ndiopicus]
MRIGLIGNDTSHVEIFTRILQDESHPFYLEHGTISGYIEASSFDLEISANRAAKYKEILKQWQVKKYETVEELAPHIDGWIIVTVDGRNHAAWFEKLAPYGKPVFIDKPITIGIESFSKIEQLALNYGTPVFTASSLRFSEVLNDFIDKPVDFLYAYGPLPSQPAMPGYYWYGIHSLEWIDQLFNCDVEKFDKLLLDNAELVTLHFQNGRKAIFRGEYEWHDKFGGVVHYGNIPHSLEFWKMKKPYYVSLLEQIISFFQTGKPPITLDQSKRVIQWIEEINQL